MAQPDHTHGRDYVGILQVSLAACEGAASRRVRSLSWTCAPTCSVVCNIANLFRNLSLLNAGALPSNLWTP
jgi:hypothetical protein